MTDPACGLCNDRTKYPDGVVLASCPVHGRSLHPDCIHPVSNMSDDYLGTTCCLCDGNVCPCAIFDLDPPRDLPECMCGDGCEDGRCEL